MNTSESIDFLSDSLLEDEQIVTTDEREFLADLLRRSESNPHESSTIVTEAIAKIAGEIVAQRAGRLMADRILRKLTEHSLPGNQQPRRDNQRSTETVRPLTSSRAPKPPGPTPPNPGPPPGKYRAMAGIGNGMTLPPKPPGPTPPNPGPPPGGI